jgi:hypothetical protein
VGDVDDLHHPVDQRQPQRGYEQPRRVDGAVYRNGRELAQLALKPLLIQSAAFMLAGGLTFSAG